MRTRFKFGQYDYKETVTSNWSIEIARGYRDLAGLGYVNKTSAASQLAELNKDPPLTKDVKKIGFLFVKIFKELNWEYIDTFTGDESTDFYSYTIIRNKALKKLVCTFSGTKGFKQLKDQVLKSNGSNYTKDPTFSVKIMTYFQELYNKISVNFISSFIKAKDVSIKQYIFVGHSLGGAMASVALFDLLSQNYLSTNLIENSPVLITYGQPRTGNYAFANEINKLVPVIFRHVNMFDLVAGVPECIRINNKCVNEFQKEVLDSKLSVYTIPNKIDEGKYFPWHLRGLILNKSNTVFNNKCAVHSETIEEDCKFTTSFSFDFHKYYYGYKISDLYKPEMFEYNWNEKNIPSEKCVFPLVKNLAEGRDIWKEAEEEERTIVGQLKLNAGKCFIWGFSTFGFLPAKKY